MTGQKTRPPAPRQNADPTVLPCNFRSAGRLSNESARTLTSLHEVMARNLTNSLDVYLGTGLDTRFNSLEQLAMDEFKVKCIAGGYMLPCTLRNSSGTILLEIDNSLMFTIIDLLLGGTGAKLELIRELTEIDEDIMEGVASIIAQEIERVWQPLAFSIVPGRCIKPNAAHRVFPPNEKVLRIRFDITMAEMTGALYLAFPASLASSLVRSVRADQSSGTGASGFEPIPSLRKRMLECKFALSGELTDLRLSVRSLAAVKVGSVLLLSAPVARPGKLTLEGKNYYEALPVRNENNKAMQLIKPLQMRQSETEAIEESVHADA